MSDDTHEQLVKAYLEYFKANEAFEKRVSYRTHHASRRWLREIRRLSKMRMEEIHEKHRQKYPNQKAGKEDNDSDN
jgi:arsenate reductase-like glutaredoxin family protein